MTIEEFTLIPKDYRKKDPRTLLYWFPTTVNVVTYAKKMQVFSFYQALEVVEEMAKRQGFILLPYSCIHWKRAKNYGPDRKIKVGRKTFFMMKLTELTEGEKEKLKTFQEELHGIAN